MKKVYLSLILPLLAMTLCFAQSEKKAKKTFPSLIQLTDVSAAKKGTVLQEHLGLRQADEMKSIKLTQDELGMTHEKFQQYYNGVIVDGATFTTHIRDGKVETLSGDYKHVEDLNVNPALAAITAFSAAVKHVGATEYMWEQETPETYAKGHSCVKDPNGYQAPAGELVVLSDGKEDAKLAYKFDIYAVAPLSRAYVYVDANTGEYIKEQNRLCNAYVAGSCATLYNGTQAITCDNSSGPYRLHTADVRTYDLNNGTNYGSASDVTSNSTSFGAGTATGNQAHYGAEKTYDYFMNEHSRDSYDGNGATILSYVSYSSNYVNAFWDGSRMTYGDGDGVNYGPLVSLDIVGHEITHGVVQNSANLVYSYESGALNESFADIFGECIENYAQGNNDWLMGDHIGAGGSGGALRNMANPNQFGDPDTYGGDLWHTASSDNGGVHINSGVQNKWFYILTVGESGTNDNNESYSVTGLGMQKAAAIAYRNLAVYLSTNSQFSDARAGAIQAATDLYGANSDEVLQTTAAWCAVGVGGGCNGVPPTCDDGQQNGDEEGVDCGGSNCAPCPCFGAAVTTMTLVTDNYGSETTWSLTSGGTTVESGSGYANNTTYNFSWNLAAGDYTFTINDSYGDGICCSYGQGSYTITGTQEIVSGGSFGSTISHNFCVDGGGPGCDVGAACDDGDACTTGETYDANCNCTGGTLADSDGDGVCDADDLCNGPEPGSACDDGDATTENDTVQSDCSCAGTPTNGECTTGTVDSNDFEGGWGIWNDGGSDVRRSANDANYANSGSYCVRLRDNSGAASSMTSDALDLANYEEITISYSMYARSMENNEDYFIEVNTGGGFVAVANYARGVDFNNNTRYNDAVTVAGPFSASTTIRFRCDASGNSDWVYIDDVVITGCANSIIGVIAGNPSKDKAPAEELAPATFSSIEVFPNPATDEVNLSVNTTSEVKAVRIFAITGKLIQTVNIGEYNEGIDVSELNQGIYIISVETDTEVLNKRFIKG